MFWRGFVHPENKMGPTIKLALKGILLTGQRPSEICSMELAELDEKMEWWTIPGSKTKNGRQHRVPINELMQEVIKQAIAARPDGAKDSDFVFSSIRKFGEPVTRDGLSRGFRQNLKSFDLSENPATPHDLRRTFTTEGGRIGIPREHRKRILNHIDNDVTAVYDLYEYDSEKSYAMEKWGQHIQSLI
ncbi:hypothetical protein GCM10011332_31200 [Terasakiella brassicae]|uniref:Tyr recombinase domain-containing protein n=2 Tax=Terasakiella brassicae TaxID=1634917 RepID=A0A917C8J8_9PROT|nr:hypothetical protein GCM10011332_31200 [Terasakiella brassicae]